MQESASNEIGAEGLVPGDKSIVEGSTRNICFVVNEQYRIFLNYAYLISGEYQLDENMIILLFSSHKITLHGVHLESLFYQIMGHRIWQVVATDSRYNNLTEKDAAIVNDIRILKADD